MKILRELLKITLFEPWPLWVGMLALTITNLYMFMFARALGVFPQMAMWGSWIYNLLGWQIESPFPPYPVKLPYLDQHSLLDLGIILGALSVALINREFKLRKENFLGYLMGAIGGFLMGLGTVLMPPCNVGGFWVATMAFSLSGPLAGIGLFIGAYIGGKILKTQVSKAVEIIDFNKAQKAEPVLSKKHSISTFLGFIFIISLLLISLIYYYYGMPVHAGLFLFGAFFGIIFQRSRICFVAAFREITISKDGKIMKWVLISIGISAIGFAILKSKGYQPYHMVFPAGWHNVLGGLIFGIGMVLAGGCGVGILVRSGEGYTRSWIAILTGMLTSGAWTGIYKHKVGQGWLYGSPVFLPEKLGWAGAFLVIFGFLFIFYLIITWLEGKNYEGN